MSDTSKTKAEKNSAEDKGERKRGSSAQGEDRSANDTEKETSSNEEGALDRRVTQIDKDDKYEDVIGRHEPSDRYPSQRR